MKRAWYLPDKYPETRKDRSNSNWSALLIIIWRDDGMIWRYDDMTNQPWWSLSYFGIRCDVVSVLSSNHFSSQQLNNHPTTTYFSPQTCQCLTAALSSLPVGWIPSPGWLQEDPEGTTHCQEIRPVAFMFFFELLFSYVSLAISFYVSLTNLFSIILFLICWLPETLKMKEKQDLIQLIQEQSKNIILRLKNLSRFSNWPLDPMVDLYQSLHSNSASTTSISPSILITELPPSCRSPELPRRHPLPLQRDQSSSGLQIQRPSSEPGGQISSSPQRTSPSLPDELEETPLSPLRGAVSIAPTLERGEDPLDPLGLQSSPECLEVSLWI